MFEPAASLSSPESSSPLPVPPVSRTAARISSDQLLGGARELVIEHAGQYYHLRLTRNDKLILTK
ncbi:MAG: hemin uptake protein HemP [Xanthomonadales bacterium]|nr:hemin uptake protein HemP [Xanthomonadales bacterium]MCC6596371.1 hemin uptake protein HemP [Rhodanobacteraceae bacterium]MDL1870270.1 hemin uptake protein HemP [Gammaproteobacteria bacterium PRO6]